MLVHTYNIGRDQSHKSYFRKSKCTSWQIIIKKKKKRFKKNRFTPCTHGIEIII